MILEVNLKRRRFNHELPVLSPTIGLGAKQNRAPKCSGSAPIWPQGEKRIRDDQRASNGDAYWLLRRPFPGNGAGTRAGRGKGDSSGSVLGGVWFWDERSGGELIVRVAWFESPERSHPRQGP
jgi:hypothetical protein